MVGVGVTHVVAGLALGTANAVFIGRDDRRIGAHVAGIAFGATALAGAGYVVGTAEPRGPLDAGERRLIGIISTIMVVATAEVVLGVLGLTLLEEAEAPPTSDGMSIKVVLDQNRQIFDRCRRHSRSVEPERKGDMMVEVSVDHEGVARATVERSWVGSMIGRCVTAEIGKLEFPPEAWSSRFGFRVRVAPSVSPRPEPTWTIVPLLTPDHDGDIAPGVGVVGRF